MSSQSDVNIEIVYNEVIPSDSSLKLQGVSIVEPRTLSTSSKYANVSELHQFLRGNIRGKTRQQLCLFVGVDPNSYGRTCGCFMACVHCLASHADSGLALFSIPAVFDYSTKLCCTRQALAGGFIENMMKKNIHIEKFPRDIEEVHILIQMYYRDLYGFKRVEYKTKVSYTAIERKTLAYAIRAANDLLFGQNLVRLIGVGSSQGRVSANECYKFCYKEYCCFKYCYGGSYSLAQETVAYLEKKNVPYEVALNAVTNYDRLWADHVNSVLVELKESRSSFGSHY